MMLRGFFPAQHDLAEEGEEGEEDGEAEHIGGICEVASNHRERILIAAVRDGEDDEACEQDADDGLADDETRCKERAAPETCRLCLSACGFAQMAVEEVAEDGTDDERRLDDGREVDAHADGERRQDEILRRALEQLVDED